MDKKNYLYLTLIVLFGLGLRFIEYLGAMPTNAEIINIVLGAISIITMYFAGLEFAGNKKGNNTALVASLFTSFAPLLINFKNCGTAFFLGSISLYFIITIFNHKSKKGSFPYFNLIFFALTGGALVYFNHFAAIFTLASIICLYLFKNKKVNLTSNILKICAILLLLSPIIFFALIKTGVIDFPIQKAEYTKMLCTFSSMFSFYSTNETADFNNINLLIHNQKTLGIGFIAFVILPTLIAAFLILKNFLKPKAAHFLLASISISTFYTFFVLSLLNKIEFMAKNLIEIYPILILLMAAGLFSIKSKPLKIILVTIFAVLNLFYFFASTYGKINLIL